MVLELSAKLLASITWLKGTRRNSGPPRKRKLAVRWRSTTATSGTTSVFGPSPIRIRQAASNYYPLHLHSGYVLRSTATVPLLFLLLLFRNSASGMPIPSTYYIPYVQSYITNRMGPEFPCREQILTPLACSGTDTNI